MSTKNNPVYSKIDKRTIPVLAQFQNFSYAVAFDSLLERGLTQSEWKPIEDFYRELLELGRTHSFQTVVVLMPVKGLVCESGAANHPYPAEARRRLEALGIPYLDGFTLWAEHGCKERTFLPQGPDAHLNADGYRLIAGALAETILTTPALMEAMRQPPNTDP